MLAASHGAGTLGSPVVDALTVQPGLETALGAALGDELESPTDPAAPRHWQDLAPLEAPPALPEGATPLADFVEAPPALARALSQIGLIEDEAPGEAAQLRLRPGQSLVSRAGAVWRWDGYTIRADAPSAAAIRLQQRNRLAALRPRLAEAERESAAARQARETAAAAEAAANEAERRARAALREAEQLLERARSASARLAAEASSATAKLAGLDEQLTRVRAEHAEAETALARAYEAKAALPDIAAARAEVERARQALAAARARETGARSDLERLARAQAARADRRRVLAAERVGWSERARDAASRLTDLVARRQEAEAELTQLTAAPERIAARRAEATTALERAGAEHRAAAAALAGAEHASTAADRAARAAESALAATRETLARAEAEAAHADEARRGIDERIAERLGPEPALPEVATPLTPDADPKSPEAMRAWEAAEDRARKRFERLTNEREQMGPVNLRADLEAREIEERIAAITSERAELDSAIAKLRGSIGHLNREGRERLAAVFEQVDRNFQALFARMFGGGRAHLALVGSDDPLEAGLEIYAQPPGKRLSTLSLLSGGEQALTALSLIFAVFRCNPAPVCVLDEVDAPLDDANVERFCNLLDDMVRTTATRFLVITHHPLSMARMDQLYGVTMQERGISCVLSVDLQRAAEMVDQPRMAAE